MFWTDPASVTLPQGHASMQPLATRVWCCPGQGGDGICEEDLGEGDGWRRCRAHQSSRTQLEPHICHRYDMQECLCRSSMRSSVGPAVLGSREYSWTRNICPPCQNRPEAFVSSAIYLWANASFVAPCTPSPSLRAAAFWIMFAPSAGAFVLPARALIPISSWSLWPVSSLAPSSVSI